MSFQVTNQKIYPLTIGNTVIAPGQTVSMPGISPQVLQALKQAGDITFMGDGAADSYTGNNARTYSASASIVTAAVTSGTDVFSIQGSSSGVVYVARVTVSGVQSLVNIAADVSLIRRSTLNTGGSPTTLTPVQHDTSDIAPTATVQVFTTPPTVGTAVGTPFRRLGIPLVTATSNGLPFTFLFGDASKSIVLRGATQQLCVNINGITIAGTLNVSVEFFEI